MKLELISMGLNCLLLLNRLVESSLFWMHWLSVLVGGCLCVELGWMRLSEASRSLEWTLRRVLDHLTLKRSLRSLLDSLSSSSKLWMVEVDGQRELSVLDWVLVSQNVLRKTWRSWNEALVVLWMIRMRMLVSLAHLCNIILFY